MLRLLTGKRNLLFLVLFVSFFLLLFANDVSAQKRRAPARNQIVRRPPSTQPATAVVVDERLSVLRFEPSLSAIPLQRMRSGRTMLVTGEKAADGVRFYRVQLAGERTGWVQTDAVVSNTKRGDDERLVKLIRAESGFEQIEMAMIFLENFPRSTFRPAILLLVGDLVEEAAQRLSRDAARRLSAAEMSSSNAPPHSFYLNFSGLDRYRRLGVNFTFDPQTKQFHYDGAAWREILQKYPNSTEIAEARKRLDSLNSGLKHNGR